VDTTVPNAARMYDYYLGGSHNFAADRDAADHVLEIMPEIQAITRANRAFLHRVVRFMVAAGIRQFLDIGSGIPTVGNVHEVAQRLAPGSRVVYVDREPVAVEQARQMLTGNADTTVIQADLRDPPAILDHGPTRALLDFSQPLGLLLVGVLLFVAPPDLHDVLDAYKSRLAPGSLMAVSHLADEQAPPPMRERLARVLAAYREFGEHVFVRGRDEITAMFTGMEIVEPGVVPLQLWRPDSPECAEAGAVDPTRFLGLGAVATKPQP
jgi:hypothetical protein